MRVPRQPVYHRATPPHGPVDRRARRCWSWCRRRLRRRPDRPDGRRRILGRRWLRWAALALAVLVLTGAGLGWALLRRLDGNLTTDVATAAELARRDAERPPPAPGEALNVLLIATDPSDSRAEAVFLLHLAGDRRSATAARFPGELSVDLPGCTDRAAPDASEPDAPEPEAPQADEPKPDEPDAREPDESDVPRKRDTSDVPFETAYRVGGAACTIRTLEELTGIRVDHHLIVDVEGFQRIVEAIGGPTPCPADAWADDPFAGQREFFEDLVRTVTDEDLLRNPTKLLPVLDAAAASITTDTELDSVVEILELVNDVRAVPADAFELLTVPAGSAAASRLYQRMREDRPAVPGPASGDGKAPSAARCA